MEDELISLDSTCTETELIRNLLYDIHVMCSPMSPIVIHCDSKFAIELCKHENTNDKMNRHMQIRHKLVWRHLKHNIVSINYIKPELNLVDYLTKGLSKQTIAKASRGMGLSHKGQ